MLLGSKTAYEIDILEHTQIKNALKLVALYHFASNMQDCDKK